LSFLELRGIRSSVSAIISPLPQMPTEALRARSPPG
jgi:hypothetical protein